MCDILEYKLPEAPKDSWVPENFSGQFYACHAEVQLLAYVFYKHTSLALMPELQNSMVKSGGVEEVDVAEALGLYTKLPQEQVWLYVDREPCWNCKIVIKTFKRKTKLDVAVFYRDKDKYLRLVVPPPIPKPRYVGPFVD